MNIQISITWIQRVASKVALRVDIQGTEGEEREGRVGR